MTDIKKPNVIIPTVSNSPQQPQTSDSMQTIKELFAGSVGGMVQVLTGQPFDTVKVRLQTQSITNPQYSGMVDCVKKTLQQEGFAGFYRGTLTPLIGVGACVSIQFGTLEYMKRLFAFDNVSHGKQNPHHLSTFQLYLAGAASGIANSVLSGPIEHVRTRLQVQSSSGPQLYSGPLDFARKVIGQYGVRKGLYKGQMITMVREFHGYGVYFATYEWLIQQAMKRQDGTTMPRNQVPTYKQVVAGAASGSLLWVMIYPIDVVKSKIQTDGFAGPDKKYSSALNCIAKTFKAEGMNGFYRGFWPCMLRASPINAATFVAYEATMNLIGR